MNPRRIASSALLFCAAALMIASLFVSWWTINFSSSYGSGTYYFLPGNSAYVVANGVASSSTYAALGYGSSGSFYGLILGTGIGIAVAAIGVAILAAFVGASSRRPRWVSEVVGGVGVVTLIASVLLVGLFPFEEPQSLTYGPESFCGSGTVGAPGTPCGSFSGSLSMNGYSASWGPDLGWYLAIAAAVLLGTAVSLWLASFRSEVPDTDAGGLAAQSGGQSE